MSNAKASTRALCLALVAASSVSILPAPVQAQDEVPENDAGCIVRDMDKLPKGIAPNRVVTFFGCAGPPAYGGDGQGAGVRSCEGKSHCDDAPPVEIILRKKQFACARPKLEAARRSGQNPATIDFSECSGQ